MVKIFRSYVTSEKMAYDHIKEFITRDFGLSATIVARFGIPKDDLISDCWSKVWRPKSKSEEVEDISDGKEADYISKDEEYIIKEEGIRLDYEAHINAYSDKLVSTYLQDRRTRQTTSVLINWFLTEIYNSQKKKHVVRLKKSLDMEEAVREILKNSSKESYVLRSRRLIYELDLTINESILYDWQIEMIDEDEACEMLGVCRATLFNRWRKLKVKLLERYYRPNHKEEVTDHEDKQSGRESEK